MKIAHANRTGNDELNVRCDECDKPFTAYELDQAHLVGPAVIHEGCCRDCIDGVTAYGWVVEYGDGPWFTGSGTGVLYERYGDAVNAMKRTARNVPVRVVALFTETEAES